MLTIIQVGHDPASDLYIKNKRRAIAEAGMESELINLAPDTASTKSVIKAIRVADYRENNTAIMVQLPLPPNIDKDKVLLAIPVDKDIDGLNPWSEYKPLTPCAIMRWLTKNDRISREKIVAVIGRSELVGKPMADILIDAGTTVIEVNSKTPAWYKRRAMLMSDIIISAAGQPDTVELADVMNYSTKTVIDVGINRDAAGKLCGDVSKKAYEYINSMPGGYCSPVPGGVGKWTVNELVLRLNEMEEQHG